MGKSARRRGRARWRVLLLAFIEETPAIDGHVGSRTSWRSSDALTTFPERYKKETRAIKLRKEYSLTPQQYDEMLVAQGSGCAICGSETSGRKDKRLTVDHCHATKKVRGLLCHHCNAGLGYFKDKPEVMRAAIAYLERHQPAQTQRAPPE